MRLPRIPANSAAPPLKWWGNAFYRVWKDWEQLVIVIRLPWWRDDPAARSAADWYGLGVEVAAEQLVVSWRQREGWRHGWRPA